MPKRGFLSRSMEWPLCEFIVKNSISSSSCPALPLRVLSSARTHARRQAMAPSSLYTQVKQASARASTSKQANANAAAAPRVGPSKGDSPAAPAAIHAGQKRKRATGGGSLSLGEGEDPEKGDEEEEEEQEDDEEEEGEGSSDGNEDEDEAEEEEAAASDLIHPSSSKGKGRALEQNGTERQGQEPLEHSSRKVFKQKTLVLTSRGITHRMRHLTKDLYSILPHSKMGRSRVLILLVLSSLTDRQTLPSPTSAFATHRHQPRTLIISPS